MITKITGLISFGLIFLLSTTFISVPPISVNVNSVLELYLDSVTIIMVSLTSFVVLGVIVYAWHSSVKTHLIVWTVGSVCLLLFIVGHVLVWYAVFEFVLMPMLVWVALGSSLRGIKASLYLVMYTAVGGSLLLIGLLMIYTEVGTWSLSLWLNHDISESTSLVSFILIFAGLMVKVPMFPFHGWLTEAHVEASTEGSVLLAALLLKFGGYGMFRFCVEVLGSVMWFWFPLFGLLSLLGVHYGMLSALVESDMKRIIAYGSVGHMGVFVIGLISGTWLGEAGAIVEMVSHGLVASSLFFGVGMAYSRVGSRSLMDIGGVLSVSPIIGTFMLLMLLANMGFPGLSSFVGETLILGGIVTLELWGLAALIGLSMFWGCGVSLRMVSSVLHGVPSFGVWSDARVNELSIIVVYIYATLALGLFPRALLDLLT